MANNQRPQRQGTSAIPKTQKQFIQACMEQESYSEKILSLRVELAQAGSSSLDLVVIADFSGELGDLYNRLRRAIHHWWIEANTE